MKPYEALDGVQGVIVYQEEDASTSTSRVVIRNSETAVGFIGVFLNAMLEAAKENNDKAVAKLCEDLLLAAGLDITLPKEKTVTRTQ